ncbi:MAG TPA: holo-ACP synthase [Thermotogota bacterium]|jgi:holo-[acyl-carrier protein] synthase|nr:holo-ACP synthase [Thermotogota bacterium]NLH19288.1 holo-ACP synthase [Thermotogaceae bacterium]OQC32449.1 MAG: Holo-(acyl-carrier-protein) synthase [Thermotogota bacterium ADurb.Bin062]HNW45788.1 holo-ACP synthase [Thermotogota bacterium]HNY81299.1 holo-ACP synthase [Thermotogota bacterium]
MSKIGIDIVDMERLTPQMIDRIRMRVFSKSEIAEMEALKNPRRRIEYFAGRFAAKEAFFKALGIGIFNTVLDQVEVLADETGRPYLRVSEAVRSAYIGEYASCSVSISHDGSYAVAVVLLEK